MSFIGTIYKISNAIHMLHKPVEDRNKIKCFEDNLRQVSSDNQNQKSKSEQKLVCQPLSLGAK